MDFDERAEYIKNLHDETRTTLEKQAKLRADYNNKKKKEMIFQEGDLVWLHLRKDRFPQERNSKLKPRGDGPFKVLKRINNNAYVIDIPTSKYLVSNTFNVADLSPYHGNEDDVESRTTLSQGGGDDAGRPIDDTTPRPPSPSSGPLTRARARAIHDKVNSLLASYAFDTSWDRSLPHAETLCVIRYEETESPPPKSSNTYSRRNGGKQDYEAVAVLPLSHSGTTATPVGASGTTALATAAVQVTKLPRNQRANLGPAVVTGTYGGTTAGPESSRNVRIQRANPGPAVAAGTYGGTTAGPGSATSGRLGGSTAGAPAVLPPSV
jgi:hypothetical protein